MLPLTVFDDRSAPGSSGEFTIPVATGTPAAFNRWWPRLLGAYLLLALIAAPMAGWFVLILAGPLRLSTPSTSRSPGAVLAATWGMLIAPTDPSAWGPAGAGVSRPGILAGLAALLWVTCVGVAALVPLEVLRRRHRNGAAHPWQLRPLQARAVIASVVHTRPAIGPLLPAGVAAARRLGLHQYGPRIGVLRDWWRAELRGKHEDSTIAVAPPRGHKTAAVVVPRVLDAPGPVVVTSTKADVLLITATRRTRLGTVWVLDAEGIAQPLATGWEPLTWNPLEGCADPDTAIRRASVLVGARPMGQVRNGDFFAGAAAGVLRCWLRAAALDDRPMPELLRWLHNLHDTTPADILDSHGCTWGGDLRALAANPGGEMVGGLLGTLQLVLSPLASPRVAAATNGGGHFRIDQFLESTDTLYLMTEGNADGAAPFVTALVDEIMHQARRVSQRRPGERLDPPLAMVLDEPANTAALPHMPLYMSDSGGRGITLTLAPQGWAQMQRRWGADGAKEIWNSATLALVMGGSKETQFLEDLSRLAGEYERAKTSHTRGGGNRSRQTSEHTDRVWRVGDLRQIPDGRALMLYQRLPAAVVDLPTWFSGSQAAELRADLALVQADRRAVERSVR